MEKVVTKEGVIVRLEVELPDEGFPSFDQVEAAGLDGTLRTGSRGFTGAPITWKQLAERLLENQAAFLAHLQGRGR